MAGLANSWCWAQGQGASACTSLAAPITMANLSGWTPAPGLTALPYKGQPAPAPAQQASPAAREYPPVGPTGTGERPVPLNALGQRNGRLGKQHHQSQRPPTGVGALSALAGELD
jgi:hypothetical protein